jgi:ABC-2 type transport system ATP-binding protein
MKPAADALAQLHGVYKRFGAIEALRGVDLAIHQGEVVALLGPNGAGKTTTISILLGVRRPDRGEVRLFGHPPHLPQSRGNVGATPQDTGFPSSLTVSEVVELVRTHYARPLPTLEILQRFGLLELAPRQTGGLSGGEKRRLAIALAFAGNPQAVFLDEPTTGLDVEARHGLWAAIRSYVHDGGTVLLTTHNMDEAEALASRVVVLDHGQILAEGSVQAIRARVQLTCVRFRAEDLPELPGIVQIEQENQLYTLYTTDADALVRGLVRQGVAFVGLEVRPVTLEEAFLNLTRGAV